NHYGAYLKEKYNGQRVFKVIVDGNFTCPNRDGSKGYGGCTYCNVDSFTPDTARKFHPYANKWSAVSNVLEIVMLLKNSLSTSNLTPIRMHRRTSKNDVRRGAQY